MTFIYLHLVSLSLGRYKPFQNRKEAEQFTGKEIQIPLKYIERYQGTSLAVQWL